VLNLYQAIYINNYFSNPLILNHKIQTQPKGVLSLDTGNHPFHVY